MASPIKISPFDLTPNRAIGVSVPFNGSAVFNSTYTTKDQIKSNIINFFLTNYGERVFNPFFGANLRNVIFEQLSTSTIDGVKSTILFALENYFPRVIISTLEVTPYPESNTLQIYFAYTISETNINDELTLSFQQ